MKNRKSMFLGVLGAVVLFSCHAPSRDSTEVEPVSVPIEVPERVPPIADGFDFPVGPPDASGYYDAQPFQENRHLGSDWNGTGGGNSDLGDPVFATANGLVKVAEDYKGGWGNVVRVLHNRGTEDKPMLIESLYAHLDSIWVGEGDTLRKGSNSGPSGMLEEFTSHIYILKSGIR
jgi:murein DD-endopeptidase MepM/ murein hydrolase activator NlpD